MPYYCSWSGGKDSTAQVILAHIYNEPLDGILFSEVMFDKKNNISGESPEHMDFVYNVAKPYFESWGYKVEILRANKDYLDVFYHTVTRGEGKGKTYGFPLNGLCAVKRDCKLPPVEDYLSNIEGECVSYVGIAVDEPARLESLHKKTSNISLLEKYGYTEQMAYDLCKSYGLLSPIYNKGTRGGCWMCPNAKIHEHRSLRKNNPEIWYQLLALEDEPDLHYGKWNCYKKKGELHRREEQFLFEDSQTLLFDSAFGDIFPV